MVTKNTKSQFSAGLNLAKQWGEIALTVNSPRARYMINLANACGILDEEFVQIAIMNQIIDDTFATIHNRSNTITIEQMTSAIMDKKHKTDVLDIQEIEEFEESE